MKVVILCGGRGTRAYPYTEHMPKPMLPVNGQPIVMHVMRIYAAQGFRNFVLSLGYRKEVIIDYFDRKHLDWNVELVDTGDDTDTAGRILGCRDVLGETFMATYSDGLADIDIGRLLAFHHSHPGLVTVTSVPLVSQYGTLDIDAAGCIRAFREKPTLREFWINAGFFVFDRTVFDHWSGSNLERDVLPALSAQGLVYAHRSDGFFKSMDTYKDQQDIEALHAAGKLP
ncbi:MAG: NTP transferase domain-containing protein [Ectothiorhodospiraceae bacterium]|nr:NTP transferase domain-containing protein [Ectothiorhodospiraceae bacterium]